MTSKKEKYLRITKKHTTLDKLKAKQPVFFRYLNDGELKMSPKMFIILTIASSVVLGFLYTIFVKKPIISFAGFVIGASLPYLMYAPTALINKAVEEALAYKEFINILQSSIRATNSTQEAIRMCANESELPKSIRQPVQKIVSDIQLGDSLETALKTAEEASDNSYFKMALTILRINHDVGTSLTIQALENIQKSQNSIIDNIQLLKDKINTVLAEKIIFMGISLASPCVHVAMFNDVTSSFYSQSLFQLVMVMALGFAMFGQLVITNSSLKALKEL